MDEMTRALGSINGDLNDVRGLLEKKTNSGSVEPTNSKSDSINTNVNITGNSHNATSATNLSPAHLSTLTTRITSLESQVQNQLDVKRMSRQIDDLRANGRSHRVWMDDLQNVIATLEKTQESTVEEVVGIRKEMMEGSLGNGGVNGGVNQNEADQLDLSELNELRNSLDHMEEEMCQIRDASENSKLKKIQNIKIMGEYEIRNTCH
jgi:hypothetical protein